MALFNLYVPVNFKEKKECWNTLTYFIEIYSPSNIIVARDLNIVLCKDPLQDTMESLIQARDLLDFKPKKGRFTWFNNRVGDVNISARLDRFLVQSSLIKEKCII